MKLSLRVAFVVLSWWMVGAAGAAEQANALAALAPRAALAPVSGEVIVRFKSDASVLRAHALAAGSSAVGARDALAGRAAILSARLGRNLEAGSAVGERTQVLRAAGVDTATLLRELAADNDVEFAVPNGRARVLAAPNDPLYAAVAPGVRPSGPDSGQWYLRAPGNGVVSSIDVEAAWARTLGSANVVVAVLDTGVRFEHPDLGRVAGGGRLLPGYDFVSDSVVANDGDGRDVDPSDPGDYVTAQDISGDPGRFGDCRVSSSSWHGTSTASLVGAATNNGIGMAGTAPGVSVLPVRVLGKCFGSDADIQAGMRWAAGIHVDGVPDNPNPAKVLNLSLGGSGACNRAYQAAVDDVLERGAVVVVAAGNSAGGPVSVPGNCRGAIGVLALRHVGTKVGFSDLGPEIAIAAPGGNCINVASGSPCLYPVLAATNSGSQGPAASGWSDSFRITVGTSFATPLVAGTVGLMFSQQNGLTPTQVRSALQATARPFPTSGGDNGSDPTPVSMCVAPSASVQQLQCYCSTALCGAGMLDAGAAVAAVASVTARISVLTASPVAGSPLQVSAGASSTSAGHSIVAWSWVLVDGGGIASGFSSATNAASAELTPTAAGNLIVRLTVTDDLGLSASVDQVVAVAAAPPGAAGNGGGGGGAMSAGWIALLAAAAAVLSTMSAVDQRAQRRARRALP